MCLSKTSTRISTPKSNDYIGPIGLIRFGSCLALPYLLLFSSSASFPTFMWGRCFLTHFIPSPQPTRATALPGYLPILASQKPAEIGSSPITVFHLPLLCDFSILFTKTYYDCYHIQRKANKYRNNKIDFTVVSILSMTMHVCNI